MFFDPKRKRWRVFYIDDHGKRRAKDFSDEKRAKVFLLQRETGEIEEKRSRHSPLFKTFAERWLRDYCRVEKAESQWRADEKNIRKHFLPAFEGRRISELKKHHLLEFRAQLKSRPKGKVKDKTLSAKTVNNLLALAKKMLSTAVDWDLIDANPWANVKPLKIAERTFDYWTLKELEEFLLKAESIDPELARIVTTAFHTGLRAGELAALRKEDLDFGTGKIRVRATIDLGTGQRYEATKNKRLQYVPMNEVVKKALEPSRFSPADAPVFSAAYFWSIRKKFARLAKAAGSRQIRFHDLRHSFASNLAMAGLDLMQIQSLMRHASYQMTLRYAHLHPENMQGLTDVLCTKPAPTKSKRKKSGAPRGT